MSQHDYLIDNQLTPAFRSDLNAALAAIVSTNSGVAAPTTTYANMIWYDTANDLLKMRNEANSGWITLGTIDQTNNVFNPNFLPATQAEAEAGSNNVKGMTPLRVAQAISALVPAGTTVDYQVFTATGTWTKPAGISANAIVHFHVIGGGAGGAAYFRGTSGSNRTAYGGPGGGGYLGSVLASSLGATVSVTVGAGSSGGTVGNGSSQVFNSSAGGTSSFGSYSVAGGSSAGVATSGSTVGFFHGFDGHLGGDTGGLGNGSDAIYGGGAGGLGTSKFAGAGGSGITGTNVTATAGSAPGGGGGGAYSTATTSSGTVTSGAGARGEVRVWTIG